MFSRQYCEETSPHIIKLGYTTSLIKVPTISEYVTYVQLKKRRFFCKNCKTTFVLNTPFVSRNNSISNNLKRLVAKGLTSKQSMSDISKQTNVSTSTVYRVLKEWYQPIQKYSYSLPPVLCFDEFKSVKKVAGSMSFIIMDSDTRELIVLLPDRRLSKLEKYFSGFSLSNREQVKYVVSDMYQPYIILTKKVFPNAKVVLDKFHLVQHIGKVFQIKDYYLFLDLINQTPTSKEFVPAFKIFKKYQEEIKNTFETSYSNGPLECMNNHIKIIKRNAYATA